MEENKAPSLREKYSYLSQKHFVGHGGNHSSVSLSSSFLLPEEQQNKALEWNHFGTHTHKLGQDTHKMYVQSWGHCIQIDRFREWDKSFLSPFLELQTEAGWWSGGGWAGGLGRRASGSACTPQRRLCVDMSHDYGTWTNKGAGWSSAAC